MSGPLYIVLHRAFRNAGDFLIFQRASRILKHVRPDREHLVGHAAKPLEAQFSKRQIASAKAIIVAGGPGYHRHMIPGVYPFSDDIVKSDIPVILLALGSDVVPGTDYRLKTFTFDERSREVLERFASKAPFVGARDNLTRDLLLCNGLTNVSMNGDPAWYDLERMGESVRRLRRIGRILFTPPARPMYYYQGKELLESLRKAFPDARIDVVFHAGVQRPYSQLATRLGCGVINIEGAADGLKVYDGSEHSIHVGYRVHAHLYNLSVGNVTYLVAEDSRGRGVHETLGWLGTNAFATENDVALEMVRFATVAARRLRVDKLGADPCLLGNLYRRKVSDELIEQIRADLELGFGRHAQARARIAEHWSTMEMAIRKLP